MKLYHFPPAPNAAKVLFYLREKGISDIELLTVNFLEGEHRSATHLVRSPRGTVPVLELDDGTYLRESLPIMEYLEECYTGAEFPCLIGEDPTRRAQVRSMERYIELNVFARWVRLVHATNSPIGLPAKPALADNEREQVKGPLAYVNELIGEGPFVVGKVPSIADCTLLAGINFMRFGGLSIDPDMQNVHAWYERFALRHL